MGEWSHFKVRNFLGIWINTRAKMRSQPYASMDEHSATVLYGKVLSLYCNMSHTIMLNFLIVCRCAACL